MDAIIALDIGTSSVRAVLYSLAGELLFKAQHEYAPSFLPDGRVRQAVETWDEAVTDVLARCGAHVAESGSSVAAISLTSQRASVIPVDANGTALSDALMWQDKTTTDQCEWIRRRVDDASMYRTTGLRTDPYFSAPKILWLRDNFPSVFANTQSFLGVQDYVALRLTAKHITDSTQASRTLLMNIERCEWDTTLLRALDLEETQLPRIAPPGATIGGLLPDIARRSGLTAGTPIILAGGDQQVAALAMGVIEPGTGEVNTGTGSFLITPVDEPTFHPRAKTLCSAAAVPGKWVAEAGVLTSGILYSWFAREFMPNVELDELNRLVSLSPPGANGVVALPHFKGSAAPHWNPYAKGVFFNLTLANTRSDLARAVLESIVLEMGDNVGLVNAMLPSPIEELVVAGGLSRFALFNQLQADVFATPVRVPANTEASAAGALLSALVSLGIHSDHVGAYEAVARQQEERLEPRDEYTKLYAKTSALRAALYAALHEAGVYAKAHQYSGELGTFGL